MAKARPPKLLVITDGPRADHAGMTIDLMPDDRWGNFAQEILYQENDVRRGSYRYRYVPINQKPNHLYKIVVSMILDREHFIENMINHK